MTQKLIKQDLIEALSTEIDITQATSKLFIDRIFQLMIETIKQNKQLHLLNFGTFTIVKTKARIGRNPKTKQEAIITARNLIKFKIAKDLQLKLNKN